MRSFRLPVSFMRGGTSKGLFVRDKDLPAESDLRDRVLAAALGSPDPYGLQLNGLGGGRSSLSKVAIVDPSDDARADVDYTFGQVDIRDGSVDWTGTCGNLSSAVGPFAVQEKLVNTSGESASLRIRATNTGKIIRAEFPLVGGQLAPTGDHGVPGIPGTAAPIRLEYLDPAGTKTGRFLPTAQALDILTLSDGRQVRVSIIDVANPAVLVSAKDLGLADHIDPDDIESSAETMRLLDEIRRMAGVSMGLGDIPDQVPAAIPKIALIFPRCDTHTLSGQLLKAEDVDVIARTVSMGQVHRSVPATMALALAATAALSGSVVSQLCAIAETTRIGTPSGAVSVEARLSDEPIPTVISATILRTARTLMTGIVDVPLTHY